MKMDACRAGHMQALTRQCKLQTCSLKASATSRRASGDRLSRSRYCTEKGGMVSMPRMAGLRSQCRLCARQMLQTHSVQRRLSLLSAHPDTVAPGAD
jgi:hypothetical protein